MVSRSICHFLRLKGCHGRSSPLSCGRRGVANKGGLDIKIKSIPHWSYPDSAAAAGAAAATSAAAPAVCI